VDALADTAADLPDTAGGDPDAAVDAPDDTGADPAGDTGFPEGDKAAGCGCSVAS
jgi:hypothetical protein